MIFSQMPLKGELRLRYLVISASCIFRSAGINVLSCSAIIALPGGDGTGSEVSLAVKYGKPIAAYSANAKLLERVPDSVPRLHSTYALREFVRRSVG